MVRSFTTYCVKMGILFYVNLHYDKTVKEVGFDAVRNKLCVCRFHEDNTSNVVTNVPFALKL